MENSKANVYTCFPITFGFSISKVLTHCNICWMQTNTFFSIPFVCQLNIVFVHFFFDHLVQVCPVIITKKVGAMAAYLCCLVPCRLWRFKFAIPQKIATASDLTQIIQIWFVGRNEGLVVRCCACFCNLFGIVFQQTLYIQFGRIAIWYLLGTCWKQMVFPQSEVSWVFRCGELGMNHQNCNFCGKQIRTWQQH